MFGLEFLFGWALLAIPLAGAPVLLHLLFRRKSPVVQFSTLRFIRASVQQTAARKRIQQWLLLACRILLLALLIWAIAQPASRLASSWMHQGGSSVAAIVVDNSYSMLLEQDHASQLDRANDAVQELLRNELRDARVAVFTSDPPKGKPESLLTASALLSEWSPLKPAPSSHPLADRVSAAAAFLDRQDATEKWLIVLSDLQNKEFPQPMSSFDGGRFIVVDLHGDDPRSVGITKVTLDPEQPVPGVLSEAVVAVTGRAGDSRAVTIALCGLDGQEKFKSTPTMANLDAGGQVELRFPVRLPNERFITIKAELSGNDDLPWDDSRSMLIEIPPRRNVRVIADASPAARAVQLALDPNEGKLDSWPLVVRHGNLSADDRAAAVILTRWPNEGDARRLADMARAGGSVVLCLAPGLEQSWNGLTETQKAALLDLLPGMPLPSDSSDGTVIVSAANDPALRGLTDDKGAFPAAHVRRLVPIIADRSATTLLSVISTAASSHPQGLLFRKTVGQGTVYTMTTLPDPMDSNLATNPAFLPLMVRSCLRSGSAASGSNVELGQPITVSATGISDHTVTLQKPGGGSYSVNAVDGRFTFDQADLPGLYSWFGANKSEPLFVTNVQLPAAESELTYRASDSIVPHADNVVVARSLADLRTKMTHLSEPEPHWSGAVAVVLLLICLEALMGSTSGLWKPVIPNLFRSKTPAATA